MDEHVDERDWMKILFGLKRGEVMEGWRTVYKGFCYGTPLYIALPS
jgi:hypothetical protein